MAVRMVAWKVSWQADELAAWKDVKKVFLLASKTAAKTAGLWGGPVAVKWASESDAKWVVAKALLKGGVLVEMTVAALVVVTAACLGRYLDNATAARRAPN